MRKFNFVFRQSVLLLSLFWATAAMASPVLTDLTTGAGAMQKELEKQFEDDFIEKNFIDREFEEKVKKEKTDFNKMITQPKEIKEGDLIFNPPFTLKKINFEGNTIYKSNELEKITNKLMGQEIHIEDVVDVASIITKKYHYDGYVTSFAYLPEQDVVEGTVTIKVVESRINKIKITGNKWTRPKYYEYQIFNPAFLKEGKVFNVSQVDTAIKTLNNEAYIKSKITVVQDDKTQQTNVNLNVKDRFPIVFNVGYDDYGRDIVGLQRARLTLADENLTGFGDRLYGGVVLASRTFGTVAGYHIPISPYGTKLAFDYGYTNVRLGQDMKPLNIKGVSKNYAIKLLQPIYRSPDTDVQASVGIDFADTQTDYGAMGTSLADYSLRVLRGNIYATHDDRQGRSLLSFNADFGLNGLGATSQKDGSPKTAFQKYGLNLIRLQKVPIKDSYFLLRLGGQYSPDKLYPYEQLQLGGYNSVRGYENGAVIGDYGLNGSVEFRTPIPGVKKILPIKYHKHYDRVKLLAFYDYGYVKTHGNIYNYTQSFFQSVGVGLNIVMPKDLILNLALGIPVGTRDYTNGSARFHFSLSTNIDQWIDEFVSKEKL